MNYETLSTVELFCVFMYEKTITHAFNGHLKCKLNYRNEFPEHFW